MENVDFGGVIGQQQAKNLLVRAKENRMNILFVAPPGYGKTLLARKYLESFNSSIVEINGTEKISNIVEKINKNSDKPILIDEAHKMRGSEAIYKHLDGEVERRPTFEDLTLDITDIDLSIIFALATTDEGRLTDALVSRLVKVALRPYSHDDLVEIAKLEHKHKKDVLAEIATLARGNPRRVKLLSKLLSGRSLKSGRDVQSQLQLLGLPMGLDARESRMMKILVSKPRGISTIAGLMSTDSHTIRMIESDLIQSGLVEVTSKGRSLTSDGIEVAKEL